MANNDATTSPPEPPNSDNIINSIKQLLAPMDAKKTYIYEQIHIINSKAEEANEKATEGLNTATDAQSIANNAIKITNDTNLKLTNLEKRIKVLEENNVEHSNQTDKTTATLQELESKMSKASKNISINSNKIHDVSSIMENITRHNAKKPPRHLP